MERFVETAYPVTITFDEVQKRLRLEDAEDIALMRGKFDEAIAIARPKSICKICYVERIDGGDVLIDTTAFRSEVLAKNLADIHRVFAYVLTCGTEVADWAHQEPDYVVGLWLDMLMEMIMRDARRQLFEHIARAYGIGKMSSINPGSGNADTWPIQQQRPLFALLGDVRADIGVTLTDSLLMLPTKSVSGLMFPSARGFVNCALCERANCQGRQVPYDPHALDG